MKTSALILGFLIACCLLAPYPVSATEGQPFEDLQRQIDALNIKVRLLQQEIRSKRLRITFRQEQKSIELDPGEEAPYALQCPDGKVVVGGGFGSEPAEPLVVKANTPFFDGKHSGWTVTFVNVTDAIYSGFISINVSCARGVGA